MTKSKNGRTLGRPRKYPFGKMNIGDYFDAKSTYLNMWLCKRNWAKNHGKGDEKFVISQIPGRKGYVRVNRVSEDHPTGKGAIFKRNAPRKPAKPTPKKTKSKHIKKKKYDI